MQVVRSIRSHFVSRQFGIFLVVGGIAAVANLGAGAFMRLFSTSGPVYAASVLLGMAVGTVVSFLLNRRYTFGVSDEPVGPQAVRFAIAALGATILGLAIAEGAFALWQLAGSPWLSRRSAESVAHATAIGLNAVYGYLAMKFFALKRRDHASPQF